MPGLVEVHVRINAAGKDVQSRGVDFLFGFVQIHSDSTDASVRHRDIGEANRRACHDGSAPDDQVAHRSAASSSRNVLRTSMATATSSSVTDSAGVWLMPPLQRTKSIATSVSPAITTASCPAPLASWTSVTP